MGPLSRLVTAGLYGLPTTARTTDLRRSYRTDDGTDPGARFTPEAPDNDGFTNVFAQTWQSQITPLLSSASRSDGVSLVQCAQ